MNASATRPCRRAASTRALRLARAAICVPLLWCLVGCESKTERELQAQVTRLQDAAAEKDKQLVNQRALIDELQRRVQTASAFTDEQLAQIIHPVRLVIDDLTGGADYDNRPGHDGVTVYLRPVDSEGDSLKVAGDVRIELYDLAAPPAEQLVGRCTYPADEARKLWYGKLMTYHFTMKCAWSAPPKHPEITIRATFVDYMTQRVMTAQAVRTVKLAP